MSCPKNTPHTAELGSSGIPSPAERVPKKVVQSHLKLLSVVPELMVQFGTPDIRGWLNAQS